MTSDYHATKKKDCNAFLPDALQVYILIYNLVTILRETYQHSYLRILLNHHHHHNDRPYKSIDNEQHFRHDGP